MKSKKVLSVLGSSGVLIVVFTVYRALVPTFDSTCPLTVAEADKCPYISIRLPRSASNVWFFFEKHGPATFDHRYRFQAPITDCLSYASAVITNYPALAEGWTNSSLCGVDPSLPGMSEDPLYTRLPWFDKHRITNGIFFHYDYNRVKGGSSIYMSMWVDRDNGTFYFFGAD